VRWSVCGLCCEEAALRARVEQFLSGHNHLRISPRGRARAAVLMGFFEGVEGVEILLIRRADGDDPHAGQVSFPGGHLEPGESIEEAALREAMEECALSPEQLTVLGYYDECVSIHEMIVSPVVAWIRSPQNLRRERSEVARIFSMPWLDLVSKRGFSTRTLRGYEIPYWTFPCRGLDGQAPEVQEETLWGLTGHMVRNLIRDLEKELL